MLLHVPQTELESILNNLLTITDKFGGINKDKAKELGYELLPGDAWIEQDVDILIPGGDRKPDHRRERRQDRQEREDHR